MKTFRTHYDNLKVARDAPDIVIRAAYKSLSQRYHPDKNPSDERAAQIMALINQSYEILSDPQRRREHDAWIAREEAKLKRQESEKGAPIPPQWQAPQATPQVKNPRRNVLAVVLLWPLKLLLRMMVTVPQLAILGLLFGAVALYDAVTPDRPPPPGPKPYQAEPPAKLTATVLPTDCRIIESSSGLLYSYIMDGARHYSNRKPLGCDDASAVDQVTAPTTTDNARPATAPNGSPWPDSAAYVAGYPVGNDRGYSKVTVDNAQGDSDVFIKLVSLDSATAFPVRHFFIPAGSSFTINKVTAGKYDLRYRDLDTGGLSRSESFDVEEMTVADGIQFSDITMTLYKVRGGNFQTYGLSESEF